MYSDFGQGQLGPLEIDLVPEGRDTVLMLAGDLDLSSRRSLSETLSSLAGGGEGRVILELSAIEFLDAAGLRTLCQAYELLDERLVLRTPSEAVRRVLELTGFDQRLPVQVGRGKVEYVRALWEAFLDGGPPAMADMVPDQVEWMPWGANGRILRGTREMREFWAGKPYPLPDAINFSELGGDVLVHVEMPPAAVPLAGRRELWSLYHFEGDRLTQAITFPDRRQALAFAL